MKFLHIADLHIGKIVNGFSLLEEQRHIFGQILKYVREHQPQAIVIAGDVYDRAVPAAEAVRLFDDFLTQLAATDVAVLLISGNHDSPERLNYASRLLQDQRLFLRGTFGGGLEPLTFTDAFGEIHFWLLPFIKPSTVRHNFTEGDIETYDAALSAVLAEANIDYSARNVLVAHQFFYWPGQDSLRSESELNPVGGLDAIDAHLAEKFDYVALGHLHRPQGIGCPHIRYAGSPLKYSFSEWQHEKSATLVELEKKGQPQITTLPLIPLRDMREIKGPLDELLRPEIAAQGNAEDYLRVVLTDTEEIIDPLGKLRSVYPNVMALDFTHNRHSLELSGPGPDVDRLQQLSPYDLFSDFFLELSGAVLSAEQAKIVRGLLETEGSR